MKLYTKISIGLIAGAVVGVGVNFLSAQFDFDSGVSLVRAVEPIGIAWVRLIRMIVVPLVVASLVVGAASLGDLRTLGRVGGKTVGFYMFTTAVAVSIGLLLSNVMKPGRGLTEESRQALAAEYGAQAEGSIELANQAPSVVDMLLSMIPDNPVGAAANAQMLPLILFSILFGVAATMIREDRRKAVLGFFEGVNDISMQIIHWIMALAPYAVFALIASVTARFGFEILKSLMWYTLVVVFGLLLHAFGTYPLILRFLANLSPLEFFKRIRAAQLLGFSTSSSSATLPVTMTVAEENLGVSNKMASFVLPLGATVNMDGTALYQGVAVMFIAQVFGIDLTIGQQLIVVLTATLASVGAAGVPSAGIITLTLVLRQAGVPETGIALIIGVDRILDMLRTSVNITGDLTVTSVIAKSEGETLLPEKWGLDTEASKA
ncbi:MAG: dicarboxylate/amino acid:cation symporter [Gemmatimonadota bacterium]|nr:dicarboxylate/amino acid:cation symporter [Gemmatimonadota bacterium]